MKYRPLLPLLLLAGTWLHAQTDLPTYNPDDINVPYKKFTLPNGLRLIVHEDHKAPIVAVNVWYHVGGVALKKKRDVLRMEVGSIVVRVDVVEAGCVKS